MTFDPSNALKILEYLRKTSPAVKVFSSSGSAAGMLIGFFRVGTVLAVGVGTGAGFLIGFGVATVFECWQDSQRVDNFKKFIGEFIEHLKAEDKEPTAKKTEILLSIFQAGGLDEDKFLQHFLPIYFGYFEIPLDLVYQNPQQNPQMG
jgi:hypothetical protein